MTTALIDQIAGDHEPGQHCVYLLEDSEGVALYVGKTVQLTGRLRAHRSVRMPWWSRVATGWWVPCDGTTEARLLERETIARYHPEGNVNDAKPARVARYPLPSDAADALHALVDAAHGTHIDSFEQRRLDAYIRALRLAGWTLAAIGGPVGWTHEAIRLREARGVWMPELPDVPTFVKPQPALRAPKVRLTVRPEIAEYLRDLQAQASRVNGATVLDDPLRQLSIDYTEQLASLVIQGVSMYHLARVVGVSSAAVRARLARHGYQRAAPSQASAAYRGVRSPYMTAEACSQGHPLSGPNLRLINGDPRRRRCRTCERAYVATYRARQRAAS